MNILIVTTNSYVNAGDEVASLAIKKLIKNSLKNSVIKHSNSLFDITKAKWAETIILVSTADESSAGGLFKYLEYAIKNNKKTAWIGHGGTLSYLSNIKKSTVKNVLSKLDLLTTDSAFAAANLRQIGLADSQVVIAQNLIFNYDLAKYQNIRKHTSSKASQGNSNHKSKLGIILPDDTQVNKYSKSFFTFQNLLNKKMKKISRNYEITYISLTGHNLDSSGNTLDINHNSDTFIYEKSGDLKDLLNIVAKQDLVLSQNYFSMALAFSMAVPVIVIGPKNGSEANLLDDLGLQDKLVGINDKKSQKRLVSSLASAKKQQNSPIIKLSQSNLNYLVTTSKINAQKLSNLLNNITSDYNFTDRPWPIRYEVIAKYLPEGQRIVDIGAGQEFVKEWIKPKKYYPIDVFKCTQDTIVADLDNDDLPKINDQLDYILAQGVFEYLVNSEAVLNNLHSYADKLVTTCYFRDKMMVRWKRRWTKEGFEKALSEAGWKVISVDKLRKLNQYVYYCESSI